MSIPYFFTEQLTDENVEALKLSQQKLLEAKAKIRQLDIEIQIFFVFLGNDGASDKDFAECDILSDDHVVLLSRIA